MQLSHHWLLVGLEPLLPRPRAVGGGKGFADSLGPRTQQYVGRQLRLLDGITLHPEIEYTKGKKQYRLVVGV